MGMRNSQQPSVPFNNPNTHSNTGVHLGGMPSRPIYNPSFGFNNVPNQLPALQNGMNSILMASSHPPAGQFFAQNSLNPSQCFNQGVHLQNGQFHLQNPIQNMNQFVQLQVPNFTQFVPGCLNQVPRGICPQNHAFVPNHQFGTVNFNGVVQPANQNQLAMIQSTLDVNALKQMPIATRGVQGSLPLQQAVSSVEHKKLQHSCGTYFPGISQGNLQKNGVLNTFADRKKFSNRNFMHQQKNDASHSGVMKSQFLCANNTKGKFRFNNQHGGKGYKNDGPGNSGPAKPAILTQSGKRRPLFLKYTEQEIQCWREERRKNYPSKANIEKKLAEKVTGPEEMNRETWLRRQQMKGILAKQAELGFEVAEVPAHYLSDSENQVLVKGKNKKEFNKKDRFQNKFNKRGRFQQNERFMKKQRSADHGSSNMNDRGRQLYEKRTMHGNGLQKRGTNIRELTLLQKLLGVDIRKDKQYLLQVFRFMVMNSFFKDRPEKPLKFPSVVVKEQVGVAEVAKTKSLLVQTDAFEGTDKKIVEICIDKADDKDCGDNDNDDEGLDYIDFQAKGKSMFVVEKGCSIGETDGSVEEEGEIID